MGNSIAKKYIESSDLESIENNNIALKIDDKIFIFIDGSSLHLKENGKTFSEPRSKIDVFIENEDDKPKMCIVKSQCLIGDKDKELFVLYFDSDLNGAISFKDENNVPRSEKLTSQDVSEKLQCLNINPKNVIEGLKQHESKKLDIKNESNPNKEISNKKDNKKKYRP